MATGNTKVNINVQFSGLGATAFQRGERGAMALIVLDNTDVTFTHVKYNTIAEFTSTEQAKFTADNVQFIKDSFVGIPLELHVFRMDAITPVIADTLAEMGGIIPKNCWIALADATVATTDAIVTWVKSENATNKKVYKFFAFTPTTSDDRHIINFKITNVVLADARGAQTGDKAVPYITGVLAGLPLNNSATYKKFPLLSSVTPPADIDAAIGNGEFVLNNDEGNVICERGVNSISTIGGDITKDMTFINVVEKMDLIYNDINQTFKDFYVGKYNNTSVNQTNFINAIRAYFNGLEQDEILDPDFDNRVDVDIEAQREANRPVYGAVVDSWSDDQVIVATVGTEVFLRGFIKIPNIMEDLDFEIFI